MTHAPSARGRAARWALGLLTLALGVLGACVLSERSGAARSALVARGGGWIAAGGLVAALAISPLVRLRRSLTSAQRALLGSLRRALGIAAASCALGHAGYSLAFVPGSWELLLSEPWLRAGLAALLALVVMLVSSFELLTRRLRLQYWDALHWLIFPASGFVSLHAALGPFGQPAYELGLAGVTALLWLSRISGQRAREQRSSAPPQA